MLKTVFNNSSFFLFVLAFTIVGKLSAQETMQVVTKSIEKSLPYGIGTEISIEGEKADIFLSSWDRNKIAIYLDLTARHESKAVAEKDLKRIKYEVEQQGEKILIRNFIDKPEGVEKPASSLKAKYTIILPKNCPVNLSNFFGSAAVSELENALVINSEFCKLDLKNLDGDISISTRFGDITGTRISGNVLIFSNRSNIDLAGIEGVFKIKSRYGKIDIDAQPQKVDLEIDAVKTDVNFLHAPPGFFSFFLTAENGNIVTPQELGFLMTQLSANNLQAVYNPGTQQSNIKIQTTFGNIVIGPPRTY